MKKSFFIILFVLFTGSICSGKDSKDSLLVSKIKELKSEIECLKLEHLQFDYQKNYFSQALDSQKQGYSDILNSYTNIISIIFGFIGLLAFGGSFMQIRAIKNEFISESDKIREELIKKSKELNNELNISINSQQEIANKGFNSQEEKIRQLFKELYYDKGQLFFTYSETLSDENFKDKFPYLISSMKYYLLSEKINSCQSISNYTFACFNQLKKRKTKLEDVDYNSIFNDLIEMLNISNNQVFQNSSEIKSINAQISEVLTSLNELK